MRTVSDDVPYVTQRQVCERWGISRGTLYRWRAQGFAPEPVRLGPRTVRYPLAAILAFEERLVAARRRS